MRFLSLFFVVLVQVGFLHADVKPQIVSGHQFRELSDFMLRNTKKHSDDFNPKEVFEGAVVYVHIYDLKRFFRDYHPRIPNRYILLTHGGDPSAPCEFAHYLDDPKLIAWLCRNPTVQDHPKLYPIPIGVKSRGPEGEYRTVVPIMLDVMNLQLEKKHLLYLNIGVRTNPAERQHVHDLFFNEPYTFSSPRKPFRGYLKDLKRSKFTVSPEGHGIDCFRTWEAILMGCIPIVKSSPLDPLFRDLPVVVINEWEEITEDFLNAKYEEMRAKTYNMKKLYIPYWKKLISQLRKEAEIL